MADLIGHSELARRAKVTAAAITKACRKQLAAAMVDGRIDAEHPAVVAYIALGARKRPPPKAPPKRRPSNAEVDELADLALRVLLRVAERLRTGDAPERATRVRGSGGAQ